MSLPYASIKPAVHAELKASLEECLQNLAGLPEQEKDRYYRRLKELCSAIFESINKNTTLRRPKYQGRKDEMIRLDRLFPLAPSADTVSTEQQDLQMARASQTLTQALERNRELLAEMLIGEEAEMLDTAEEEELPDLRKAMEADIQVLRFELSLKDKWLESLRQGESVACPKTQDASVVEAQVARFLDQGF